MTRQEKRLQELNFLRKRGMIRRLNHSVRRFRVTFDDKRVEVVYTKKTLHIYLASGHAVKIESCQMKFSLHGTTFESNEQVTPWNDITQYYRQLGYPIKT